MEKRLQCKYTPEEKGETIALAQEIGGSEAEVLTNQVFNIKLTNSTEKTICFIKISLKFLQKY